MLGCAGLLLFSATGLVCAGGFAGGRAFNAGPVVLGSLDDAWTVHDHPDVAPTDVARAISTHYRPMGNGLNVLVQHLWSNAMTSGYDRQVWMEGPSSKSHGLYFWSEHLFLRDEDGRDGYRNRVFTCDGPVVPGR